MTLAAKDPDPRRADSLSGALLSIMFHVLLILVGGWLWVKPITYGVTAGESSIEVDLVAAPAAAQPEAPQPVPALSEPAPEPEPKPIPDPEPPVPSEAVQEKVIEPAPRPEPPKAAAPALAAGPIGDGSSPVPGRDAITLRASAGAQVAARPNYLRNPAPRYPEASRKNSEEGLVMLAVEVSPSGRPVSVELASSSGFERLDRAAVEAVKRWVFEPARLGPLPVASNVKVPVRFRLSDRS
jgi:protein TonB